MAAVAHAKVPRTVLHVRRRCIIVPSGCLCCSTYGSKRHRFGARHAQTRLLCTGRNRTDALGLLPHGLYAPRLHTGGCSPAMQDADGGSDPEAGASQQATVPFSQLYDALGRGLTNDRSVLLLYALLYGCQPFQVMPMPAARRDESASSDRR